MIVGLTLLIEMNKKQKKKKDKQKEKKEVKTKLNGFFVTFEIYYKDIELFCIVYSQESLRLRPSSSSSSSSLYARFLQKAFPEFYI